MRERAGKRENRPWQREGKQLSNTKIKMPNKKTQTIENYKLENYFQSYFTKYFFRHL